MRRLITILSLFLFLVPLQALAAGNVTTFTLKNGMQAVVIEDHRAPVVMHMVWYRVGSADEQPGKSGIAHLLEHLMFKGTKRFGPGKFSAIVAANGGSENAFTNYDTTAYFQRVASERLGMVMEMEADRMRGLVLTDNDVKTERDVVLEERAMRVDNNPGALFTEQRRAAQYLNHHYGIPIIGWRQEVEKLAREDALAFYRKFYAPNNAILIVAGDVYPDEVRKLAEKYYGPIAPTPGLGPRNRPGEPPQLAERRLRFSDPRISQPYVIRTYLAPERNPGDQRQAAALTLLAELLGGSGLNSVLGQKLQLEQKVALNTSAFYGGVSLDKTTFGLLVVPAKGVSLGDAEKAMDKAVAQFLKEGVDRKKLASLKNQIRASQIYGRDSLSGLARKYGDALTAGLAVKDVQEWPDILQSITPQEIIDAAHKVFDRRRAVTGWVMKQDSEAVK